MKSYLTFTCLLLLFSCSQKQSIDTIVFNAKVYTVNADFKVVEAFAVDKGKFIGVGNLEELEAAYKPRERLNAEGNYIYPGFYDAHCHFYGLGRSFQNVDLVGTTSYSEILERVKIFAENHNDKTWILGRGWDQNDWEVKAFPTKDSLDILFPNTAILLNRIDGHAAIANQKALDLAGITKNSQIEGGSFRLHEGTLTGVLIDNASGLVEKKIPEPTEEDVEQALKEAQYSCFSNGLTTVSDAGSPRKIIEKLEEMYAANDLKIRLYVMAEPQDRKYIFQRGKIKTDRLNIRSFKLYADGALGSRGACLLAPYSDRPQEMGFLLTPANTLQNIIEEIYQNNFQVNTHCIGDSANRLLLDIYGTLLKGNNDKRWRIEHAQVVESSDIQKFGQFSIIPSVQPTHATSDMYWVTDRLGKERAKNAYPFKELMQQNGLLALGSDFPVEKVNPLLGFYAAIARRDSEGYPEKGFQMENALDRISALKGMTLWAAYSNFEDTERGSIEVGKQADFVILSKNIMTIPEPDILNTQVLYTFVGGEEVYKLTNFF